MAAGPIFKIELDKVNGMADFGSVGCRLSYGSTVSQPSLGSSLKKFALSWVTSGRLENCRGCQAFGGFFVAKLECCELVTISQT